MAQVTVDVAAKVATAQLNRSVNEIQRRLDSAGRDAGMNFGNNFATGVQRGATQANKALKSTEQQTNRVRQAEENYQKALRSGDREKVIQSTQKLTKAYRNAATEQDRLAAATRNLDSVMRTGQMAPAIASQGFMQLAKSGPGAALAITTVAAGLAQLAGIGAAAAQSMWALPGVLTAVGSAFATVKLATHGLEDVFTNMGDPEKFAESLRKVAPSAQDFALSIKGMMPALKNLQQQTQQAFFAGTGPMLSGLADQFLPEIQQLTTGIAGAMNQAFSGVAAQLMTPDTQASIHEFIQNTVTAFQNLGPALAPLSGALADLMAAGSGVLPDLASAATDAATAFASFIREARASGELDDWIREGMHTLGQLGDIIWDVGKIMADLIPIGQQALPTIVKLFDDIATVTPYVVDGIEKIGPALDFVGNIAKVAQGDFSGLTDAVGAFGDFAVSTFEKVRDVLSAMFDPIREGIDLANKLPGVNIPQIPDFSTPPGPAPSMSRGALDRQHGLDPRSQVLFDNPRANVPGAAARPDPFWGQPSTGRWGSDPFGIDRIQRERQDLMNPGGGANSATGPQVPYTGDPMSLLQGMPVTPELYSSAQSVLQAQHKREQEQAELNELIKSNNADANEIQKAKNELAQAEQDAYEADLRLTEAKQSATEKQIGALSDTAKSLEGFGVELSRDMGISEGLGGILSNIVKFVASLAAAPLMGQLSAIASQKDPAYGKGLLGMAAAPFVTPSQSYDAATGYFSPTSGGFPFGVPGGGPMNTNAQIGFVDKIADQFGLDMTSGKRANAMTASGKSWHLSGEAGDFSNGSGNTPQMKAFAEYMSANFAPYIQELIYSAPGFNGNLLNGQPHQYSQGTLDDHRDHVHVAIKDQFKAMFEQMFGSSSDGMGDNYDSMFGPGGTPWSADWNKMAQLEASGNWQANTGNGYYGGLQFLPSSWQAAGGDQFAPRADLATPYQQAMTAEQLLKMQGPGAWPNTFTPGSSGPAFPQAGGTTPFPQSGGPIDYGPAKSFGDVRGWTPNSSGGIGFGGGLMGMAAGAGGMALNGLAPGAGMAAEMGIKAASKLIEFAGEQAGHLGNGIMETFGTIGVGGGVGGGDASISSGWLGRAVGAAAGAGVEIGNVAGKTADQTVKPKGEPNDPSALAQKGGERGQQQGTTNNVWNVSVREEKTAAQMANQLQYQSYSSGQR